jgi:hypothetical protein
MNDLQTQIDLLEQQMLDHLLTAQLAANSVVGQAQAKMAEHLGRLISELKDAQAPVSEARRSAR